MYGHAGQIEQVCHVDGSGSEVGSAGAQLRESRCQAQQACEGARMPDLTSFRPPQYAAAIAVVHFPGTPELCEYACITGYEFEAMQRLAIALGDELIVLGTGHDDEGQMGASQDSGHRSARWWFSSRHGAQGCRCRHLR